VRLPRRKRKEEGVSLSESQSKPNERVNGRPSQEQGPQGPTNLDSTLQALLGQVPGPLRGVVENLLPQIVSFIDSRIEAKLKEYLPKFGEVTRQAIEDLIKQHINQQVVQGQGPNPNPIPNPVQVPQQEAGLSQRDILMAQFLQSILGRRGIEDELKRFAEVKQLAEAISGGGLNPMEVFKVYRYGLLDSIRMLYLMTRKKFPLEKLLELEEEKEGESK
jgi:hypothetical protein